MQLLANAIDLISMAVTYLRNAIGESLIELVGIDQIEVFETKRAIRSSTNLLRRMCYRRYKNNSRRRRALRQKQQRVEVREAERRLEHV